MGRSSRGPSRRIARCSTPDAARGLHAHAIAARPSRRGDRARVLSGRPIARYADPARHMRSPRAFVTIAQRSAMSRLRRSTRSVSHEILHQRQHVLSWCDVVSLHAEPAHRECVAQPRAAAVPECRARRGSRSRPTRASRRDAASRSRRGRAMQRRSSTASAAVVAERRDEHRERNAVTSAAVFRDR